MTNKNDDKKCMIFRCPTGCGVVMMASSVEADVLLASIDQIEWYLRRGASPEIVIVKEFKAMPAFKCQCLTNEIEAIKAQGELPSFWDVGFEVNAGDGENKYIEYSEVLGNSEEDAVRRVVMYETGLSDFKFSPHDNALFVYPSGSPEWEWEILSAKDWSELATPVSRTRRLELAGMPTLPLGVTS